MTRTLRSRKTIGISSEAQPDATVKSTTKSKTTNPAAVPAGPKNSLSEASNALLFPRAANFETWLHANHDSTPKGIWLQFSKKAHPVPSITYEEALDIALCYGWIDGQCKSLPSGTHSARRFTPRRKASLWSKRNVSKVAALQHQRKMMAAGLKEVEAAKADGRWERAYSGAKDVTVPMDFEARLKEVKGAWTFWEGLNKTARYAFLVRLETTKTAVAREKKLEQFVKMLADGKLI
ncbi:bacteriocin-protection, YdeI or OmpD-associated-domain-containing protein [Emericellopsis atlantica]|uniref:Bacteriocin-protection, YdeI or OmpD-associated-domain-containing protein n=1 Tax=Emericellopsis atlantica TaxID=2614577 RepID=A0A9P8CSB9_9HYPO|nr:bacteriocin-protection, YdeI or OmpD-associated-domain-containing protein [Emericellopsis atlantica]KAG9255601.1 bacteriocin-protection, YdeI or OmpD-associated-domain-containing protein [Emericellopsis atlantica]